MDIIKSFWWKLLEFSHFVKKHNRDFTKSLQSNVLRKQTHWGISQKLSILQKSKLPINISKFCICFVKTLFMNSCRQWYHVEQGWWYKLNFYINFYMMNFWECSKILCKNESNSPFGSSSSSVVELSVDAFGSFDESPFEPFTIDFAETVDCQ